jgi:tetratricopeptide (TPR) repeat protein
MRHGLLFLFLSFTIVTHAQFKLYEQGIDAYHAKKYEKAITHLNEYMDRSVRDKALDVEVHYVLALSYFKTNSFTSSVREFDRALELGHQNKGNIHWFMAKGYGELRAYKESSEEFGKALENVKEPANQSKIYYDRALQYERQTLNQLAIDDLKKAVILNNGNAEAKNLLARLEETIIPAGGLRDMGKDKVEPTASVKSNPKEKKETKGNTNSGKPPLLPPKDKNVVAKSTEVDKQGQSVKLPVVASNDGNKSPETPTEKSNILPKQSKTDVVSTGKPEKKETPAVPLVAPAVEEKPLTLAEIYKNEKRYALVIGNAKYKSVAPLKNSANDASDIAAELERSNFEVIKVIDGDYNKMREAFTKFHEKLSNGPKDQTVGLFYYAGHGLQNEGENYLVPIEANIKYDDDIPRMCLPMHRVVLANMERSSTRMNIVIMDACRNNPFPSSARDIGGGGLAEIKRAKGSFIAYATSPGATASDGDGRNGLYTQELLKAMKKPGRTIEQVFKEVRMNVLKLSEDKQNTWDSSNIIGEFYFKF